MKSRSDSFAPSPARIEKLPFSFASSPACLAVVAAQQREPGGDAPCGYGITSDLAAVVCSLVEWLVVSSRGLGRGERSLQEATAMTVGLAP